MEQRVALVIGGAKRVGAEIARRLAQAGFQVAFTYHTSQVEADRLSRETNGLAIRADLREPEVAVAEIHRAFLTRFGRLDVLVNSASLFTPGRLADTTPSLMRQVYALHVEAPLLLCQAFAQLLRDSRGHVINMIDIAAERPLPVYLAYSASKAALQNLTLGLARELAPEVTVNGISPGVVDWPDAMPQVEREAYLKKVPLARAGTPQDVAELVLFLTTHGTYITGQIIRLDGGRLLQ